MNITPFLRPIQVQGGTFYTMPSSSEDLTFTFNNDGKQFKFSKYVLLNIPNVKQPTQSSPLNLENYVQFDAIPGGFQYVTNDKSYNLQLAESLQNYVMNFETLLTVYDTYDATNLQTVSERVFFKWLKEIGALRFREASTSESSLTSGLRFTEEDSSSIYTKVVQYVGEIDIINSLKNTADAYSEVYIHVPTKEGATPLVLFKSLSDENYFSSQIVTNSVTDSLNLEYIYGRTYSDENSYGLDIKAFFDSDSDSYGDPVGTLESDLSSLTTPGEYKLLKYDSSQDEFVVGWWFLYPEANSYCTQPSASTGSFDDPSNDALMIKGMKSDSTTKTVQFLRSRLDGIQIDFETNDYYPISSNSGLSSFSDFNSLPKTSSFEFNTVLIYYDITDVSSNETATNLFGVLFLDDMEDSGSSDGGCIPRYKKYKPDTTTGLNGNSYGFKLNLKFDVNTEDSAIVTSVNDYSTFSLELFVDALNNLQLAADTLSSQTDLITTLSKEVESLKNSISNSDDLTDLTTRIETIETELESASAIFESSTTLTELITRNYDEIINIYNNYTSVNMSYNLDVIREGDGMTIDRSTPNVLTLNASTEEYSISDSPLVNILTDFTSKPTLWMYVTKLLNFGNYLKISNDEELTMTKNVCIYINDTENTWKTGQTFEIVIDNQYPMDMYSQGQYDLIVYTDASNVTNSGEDYSVEIGRISSTDFYSKNGCPKIKIICLNASDYSFTCDLF